MYRKLLGRRIADKDVVENMKDKMHDKMLTKKNVEQRMEMTAKRALELLLSNKLHVSFVESCTGGMAASEFIGISGASGAIEQSFITYSNDAKHKMVGVNPATLEKNGAISYETACEMAEGGARQSGSDICISITGNAGPGVEEDKPVGLVYIGCYYDGKVTADEFHFEGTRQEIRRLAVQKALEKIISNIY